MEHEVLIGTVKSEEQLRISLEDGFYHIPEAVVPQEMMPVQYVALYLPEHLKKDPQGGCIPYYGEVSSIEVVPRERIPVFPIRNGELQYYKINVKEWKRLPQKIRRNCGSVYTKAFTTLQKLLDAQTLSDLVDTRFAEVKKVRTYGFSEEEKAKIFISDDPVGVKLLTKRINEAAGKEKLIPVQISRYLLEQGYLTMELDEKTGQNNRVASEKGKQLGIETFWELNKYYREYCKNYYNRNAQQFIIDHLNEIIFIPIDDAYQNEI